MNRTHIILAISLFLFSNPIFTNEAQNNDFIKRMNNLFDCLSQLGEKITQKEELLKSLQAHKESLITEYVLFQKKHNKNNQDDEKIKNALESDLKHFKDTFDANQDFKKEFISTRFEQYFKDNRSAIIPFLEFAIVRYEVEYALWLSLVNQWENYIRAIADLSKIIESNNNQ